MITYNNAYAITLRILSLVIVVFSTKAFAVLLPETSFGELALYNVLITLPSTAFFAPISQGVIRYLPVSKEHDEACYVMSTFDRYFRIGSLVIVAIAFALIMIGYGFSLTMNFGAIFLVVFLAIGTTYTSLQYGIRNVEGQRVESMLLEFVERASFLMLSIFLLKIVFVDAISILAAQTTVVLLMIVYLIAVETRKNAAMGTWVSDRAIQKDYDRKITTYSYPFLVFGIVAWLQLASERWILEWLLSTESVAEYAIVNQIGFQSLTLLIGIFGYFVTPALFRRAKANSASQILTANSLNDRYLIFIAGVTVIGFLVSLYFSRFIIELLADEKYVSVAWLLPWMLLAGGVFNLAQAYANRFMVALRTDLIIIPRVASGLIGLVLNVVLIRSFGLPGLVLSMLVAHACYALLLILSWKLVLAGNLDRSALLT